MIIPEQIPMHASLYGDGAKGFAWQQRRNDEYGVQEDAIREHRGAPWNVTFTSDFLPEREFSTFGALREALADIESSPFTMIVLSVEASEGRNRCWSCRERNQTQLLIVQTGWRVTDVSRIPCCDECLESTKVEPRRAIQARRAHVRQTKL